MLKRSNHGPLQYVNQLDTARRFNDVAKDKQNCFIIGSVRADVFTVSNRKDQYCQRQNKGRTWGYRILQLLLGVLPDNGLLTYVINPLYRKNPSLRKTSELKFLTRYRVKERATLKSSDSRLVPILFPELEKRLPTLHSASSYALLILKAISHSNGHTIKLIREFDTEIEQAMITTTLIRLTKFSHLLLIFCFKSFLQMLFPSSLIHSLFWIIIAYFVVNVNWEIFFFLKKK